MSIIEKPLQLQHLSLKNRIIRSAVHSFLADTDGCSTFPLRTASFVLPCIVFLLIQTAA